MSEAQPSLTYRLMEERDLAVTRYIFTEAIEWLERSLGRPTRPMDARMYPHNPHLLATDPGGSWIAENRGLPVGFAHSFTRSDVWFLAQLFVQPAQHAHGIGRELLSRATAYARASGARVLSVVASPSPSAHRLYMGAGMFARGVGYNMSGPSSALRSLPETPLRRLVEIEDWSAQVATINTAVYGADRHQDRAFFIEGGVVGGGAHEAWAAETAGRVTAYGCVSEIGRIGPVAALEPEAQLAIVRAAAEWLSERGIEQATAFCLSANNTVMRALLEAGWRMDSWNYFLASEDFGQMEHYLPSGGMML